MDTKQAMEALTAALDELCAVREALGVKGGQNTVEAARALVARLPVGALPIAPDDLEGVVRAALVDAALAGGVTTQAPVGIDCDGAQQ